MKATVYINRHRVAANKKNGTDDPCIAVKTYRGVRYTKRLELPDGWVLRQDFANPICSGATIWLEGPLDAVRLVDATPFHAEEERE